MGLEKVLLRKAGRAIADYSLIEDGDRIMVALSGGKDSWALLHVLEKLRQRAPVTFSLVAVNIDPGFPGFRSGLVEGQLRPSGFTYHMERSNIHGVISGKLGAQEEGYCA